MFMTILSELGALALFVVDRVLHSWYLFALTIPLAALVRISGVGALLGQAMNKKPLMSVLLATLIGAFSPLCSCSVIPVVTGLLISGVPLAPVLSFWLASPSMDPEIFFLSVSTLGWDLALWRMVGTTLMSFGAGLFTLLLHRLGWFRSGILKKKLQPLAAAPDSAQADSNSAPAESGTPEQGSTPHISVQPLEESAQVPIFHWKEFRSHLGQRWFQRMLLRESLEILGWLGKFMLLAFLLEGIIARYLPESWITGPLGSESPWALLIGLGLGLPLYTNNLAALGIVGGLMGKGMSGAAALAFLIGGATTTIPAMAAVWGVARRRVFALYLGFTTAGALLTGLLWQVVQGLG